MQQLRPRVAKKSGKTSKAGSGYDPGLRRRAEGHQRHAAATTPGCEEERKDIKGRQQLRPRVAKKSGKTSKAGSGYDPGFGKKSGKYNIIIATNYPPCGKRNAPISA